MDVEVVAEGEVVDFVEGVEEAEGDSTTTKEGEEVVAGGAGAEVEEVEEGEVVCVAVEESSQILPLPVATGSALIQSKSVMQTTVSCTSNIVPAQKGC